MDQVDRHSETQLLRRARSDPASFGELYRRLVPEVYAYLLRLTRDAEDARDLTAETFLRVLEELPRFHGRRSRSGRVWVFRIAQRLAAQQRRSRHAETRAADRLRVQAGAPPISATPAGAMSPSELL